MDYSKKYIKYKTKYLNEKKKQNGGYIVSPYPIGMPAIGMPQYNSMILPSQYPYIYPYQYPNSTYADDVNNLVQKILNTIDTKKDTPKSKEKLSKMMELFTTKPIIQNEYKNDNIKNIIARIYANVIEFTITTKTPSKTYKIQFKQTVRLVQKVIEILSM
jgi:hypothetical protein